LDQREVVHSLSFAILLTFAAAVLINWAWIREHDAASALPPLSIRKPRESIRILLGDRSWVAGFLTETGGFLCYVGALALAPLALVQSLSAGGIGVLAFLSSRIAGVKLSRRELVGVIVAATGLAFLGVSLAGATGEGNEGAWGGILIWLGASAVLAALAVRYASRFLGAAAAYGVAAGILLAAGDVTTKAVVSGGARLVFIPAMIVFYTFGTIVLQLGFQRGAALTTGGVATLFTNALPIIAGTTLYDEPFPNGELGVLRGIAFALLITGGALLSRPKPEPDPKVSELELAGVS
jgi:drug/metabolite transporter (DMT)-like permease